MCYGERRGMGGDVFAAVWRCGVSWLRVTALVFRWLCLGVTHPRPLSRGEVGMLFLDIYRYFSEIYKSVFLVWAMDL